MLIIHFKLQSDLVPYQTSQRLIELLDHKRLLKSTRSQRMNRCSLLVIMAFISIHSPPSTLSIVNCGVTSHPRMLTAAKSSWSFKTSEEMGSKEPSAATICTCSREFMSMSFLKIWTNQRKQYTKVYPGCRESLK